MVSYMEWVLKSPTHGRSGWALLSGWTGGTHGHVPVERTHSGTRPLHRVGKGGHLLQNHFLTNLDHVLSRERRTLCNESSPHPSLDATQRWNMEYYGTGYSEATAAKQQQMKPAIFPRAHYVFIATLTQTPAESLRLQPNEKPFKRVPDTRGVTKHGACSTNDYFVFLRPRDGSLCLTHPHLSCFSLTGGPGGP